MASTNLSSNQDSGDKEDVKPLGVVDAEVKDNDDRADISEDNTGDLDSGSSKEENVLNVIAKLQRRYASLRELADKVELEIKPIINRESGHLDSDDRFLLEHSANLKARAEEVKTELDNLTTKVGPEDNDEFKEEKKVVSVNQIGAALMEAKRNDDNLLAFLDNLNIKAFRLRYGLLKRDLEKLTRNKSEAKKVRALLFDLLGFTQVPTFKEYRNRIKDLKEILKKDVIKKKLDSKSIDTNKTTIDEKAEEIYGLVDVADKLFEDSKDNNNDGKEEYLEFIELTESPTITPKRVLGAAVVAGAVSTIAVTGTLALAAKATISVGKWSLRTLGRTLGFGADYIDELKLKDKGANLGDAALRTVVDPFADVGDNIATETKGAYGWVIDQTNKWFGKKEAAHPKEGDHPKKPDHPEENHKKEGDHPKEDHAKDAAHGHDKAHAKETKKESKPGMFSKLWSGTKNLASKAWGVAKDLPRAAAYYGSRAVMVPGAILGGGIYGLGKGIVYGARDFLGIKRREVKGVADATPPAAPAAPAPKPAADGHDHGHDHAHGGAAAPAAPKAAAATGDVKKEFFVEGGLVGSLFAAGSILKEMGWDAWRRTAKHRAEEAHKEEEKARAKAGTAEAKKEHKGFNVHDIYRFGTAAAKVVTDFDDDSLEELGHASADLFDEKFGALPFIGVKALMVLKRKLYPTEKSTLEEVDLDNIGKQISRLDRKDVNKWLHLLDLEDFVHEYEVLISGKNLDKIAETPQGRAALKLKIKHLFGTDVSHEHNGLEELEIKDKLESIKAKFGKLEEAKMVAMGIKDKPSIRGKYEDKLTKFLAHMEKITGHLNDALLKKIYVEEIKESKKEEPKEKNKDKEAGNPDKPIHEAQEEIKKFDTLIHDADDAVHHAETKKKEDIDKAETAVHNLEKQVQKVGELIHSAEAEIDKIEESKKSEKTSLLSDLKHKLEAAKAKCKPAREKLEGLKH